MAPLDFNATPKEEKAAIKRRKAAISRRIRREVLAELGIDKLPRKGERTLITGAQGTGKSRTVAETIAELPPGLVIWWLVPTLEKAEEQVAEYQKLAAPSSMPAQVVRGRGAPDPSQPGEAMCPRHLAVNRAAAMGVNVQNEICDDGCSLKDECGFQAQRAELSENPIGLFVMAADYLWLPCPAPRHDLVIVDESIIHKAAEIVSFAPSRIVDDHKWAGGELDQAMERRRVAVAIRAAITQHPERELTFLRDNDVTVAGINACIKHLATRREAKPSVNGRMSDRAIAAALDAVEAREIVKVLKLFRQVAREMAHPRFRLNSVWFDPQAWVKVGNDLERAPQVFVGYLKSPRLAKETPVLVLDGTGALEINRKIFGQHMTAERFAVPRDAEVIQVSTKTFSRQSITGADRHGNEISAQKTVEAQRLRRQVLDLLKMLPGDVLLATYKQAEEILLPRLPPHVQTAHFGALRGLNSFEHCSTAVVMGREQPSAQAIEALTRPFCATDRESFIPLGEYVLQSRGRRMRTGGANVVEVQVHPDPRCQDLLEQVREAEIVQAVDRVRPVFNRRRIIVLTNIALDLTVDQALTWPELRPGKFAYAFARYGVLPLSAGDLTHCFPDLWKSEAAAKEALRPRRKTGGESQIDYLFGETHLFFSGAVRAAYRRKYQRGPLARALMRADLPNPRAVLERLVGELVEFRIERAARSSDKPSASDAPPRSLPPLERLAAALSAEGHLLATLSPDARPPDVLGMTGVMKLMALAAEAAGAGRAAAA